MAKNFRLKELRDIHGLEQKDLAEKLNITPSSYAMKENGRRGFKQKEINILLRIFDTTYENIFLPRK